MLYDCKLSDLPAGKHTLTLLFGNRFNSFGQLHPVNERHHWFGPGSFRTKGDDWCYEYRLRRFGILKSPIITVLKNKKVQALKRRRFCGALSYFLRFLLFSPPLKIGWKK